MTGLLADRPRFSKEICSFVGFGAETGRAEQGVALRFGRSSRLEGVPVWKGCRSVITVENTVPMSGTNVTNRLDKKSGNSCSSNDLSTKTYVGQVHLSTAVLSPEVGSIFACAGLTTRVRFL